MEGNAGGGSLAGLKGQLGLYRMGWWKKGLAESYPPMHTEFPHDSYLIRRKVFTLFGGQFHVYDPHGQVVLFSRQKAFKLREDIRVYTDETETEERLWIRARQIIDFSAAYDVLDSQSGQLVGTLRRKGFSSLLRDSWEFLDARGQSVGKIVEDSMVMALLRRLLTDLIPQAFHATVSDQPVASYRQRFNPFIFKLEVQLAPGASAAIRTELLLAAGILLTAVEGRQG